MQNIQGIEKKSQIDFLENVNILKKKFGESFYLFDLEKLRANYLNMFSAFSSRYNKFIIGYSYNTNYFLHY